MSHSTVASSNFAAHNHKKSPRKAIPNHVFGGVAIACLVLGCAWTLYANVFGASIYPTMAGGNFDAPVIKPQSVLAVRSAPAANNVLAVLPEPAPVVSAPATIASIAPLMFNDRFAAAAPQSVEPKPQQTEVAQQAEAPKPQTEVPKAQAVTQKPQVVSRPPAPAQIAQSMPLPPGPAEAQPAKSPVASVKDMAQRAKAAVMSIASNEKQTIVEKLWGKPQPHGSSLLSFASADANVTGSLGPSQNPALAGSQPRYDRSTAVYDITARTVYLSNGTKLEAHSGLGSRLDDPRYVHIKMHGATPPHVYDLSPREALFHGVPALRLTPIGGQEAIHGRTGLLAHTYMLGPNGDSNGCVSFKDYYAFLKAYRNGEIKRLAVVARVD